MTTISTRTYTNVALTAIILLLLALVAQPYVSLPKAAAQLQVQGYAQNTNTPNNDRKTTTNPEVEGAAATRDVASALREIASALREQGNAQKDLARGMMRLAGANSPTENK